MSNKRITELDLTPNPLASDVVPIARPGSTTRASLGSIVNSEFPATFGNTTINGNLDVNGTLSVSTLVSSSVLYESGSTIFGNSFEDTHQFTGSLYVSGAVKNVDYIDFNTSSLAPGTPGRLQWNEVDGTLDLTLKRGNVTLQIGQETLIHAYNATTSSLLESEHKAVYVSSSISNSPAIQLANNLSRIGSENTIGIVTETIPPGETGYITTQGLVRNIDMSAYQAGDTLYLGSSDGVVVNQPPLPPALTVILGYCIDNSTSGSMYVNVRSGFEYPQYAVAYNTVDHSASLANTEELLDLTNPAVLSGISLENQTKFIVSTPGLYKFIISSQIERVSGAGTAQVYFWAKKNGVDVPNSNNNISITGNTGTAATLLDRNLVIVLEEGDYIQFYWATDDTDMVLKYSAAGTSPIRPATPAVKVTATRIS